MAKFYKRQQKMIDKFLAENPNGVFLDFMDLPIEFIDKLEAVRDTETLHTDVSRYLWDKNTERRYGGR